MRTIIRSSAWSAGMRGVVTTLHVFACVACADTGTDAAERAIAEHAETLRAITNQEALADFDELTQSFQALYGAMSRKESRYGFKFDDLVSQYRARTAAATAEADYLGIATEFVARFHDAHVELENVLNSDGQHDFELPFLAMPIADTYTVYAVEAQTAGSNTPLVDLRRGDELLSIGGTAVSASIDDLSKYTGAPNPVGVKHLAALQLTQRPSYASAGIQAGAPVIVHVRGADGTERDVTTSFQEVTSASSTTSATPPKAGVEPLGAAFGASAAVAEITRSELQAIGATKPFYMTQQVVQQYGVTPVTPSDYALARAGISSADSAKVAGSMFAATYQYGGHRLLLLRMPSYTLPDLESDAAAETCLLAYIRALLSEQASRSEALVFDQTHNPGGSLELAQNIAALFARRGGNGVVQKMHADRRWIAAYEEDAQELETTTTTTTTGGADSSEIATLEASAKTIDDAYSQAQELTAPLPFPGIATQLDPSLGGAWTKPMIVLDDELSVSAAETFALLIQANGIAPLFGARTMGAGGNVELAASLWNSQDQLNLSRGLTTVYDPTGAYPEQRFIEDNGVAPDVAYDHTLQDFRAGYVGYVDAFSRALVAHLSQ